MSGSSFPTLTPANKTLRTVKSVTLQMVIDESLRVVNCVVDATDRRKLPRYVAVLVAR